MSSSAPDLPYRPCVGVLLLNGAGRVWIGRRTDAPADEGSGQWWQMPQGGIDPDEDPRAAALRELYEETNIRSVEIIAESEGWLRYDLPKELVGVAWKGRYCGQKQKWFAMRFVGDEAEIDVDAPGGHKAEFDAWRWAKPDKLADLVVPFKRDVYVALLEEFAALLAKADGG